MRALIFAAPFMALALWGVASNAWPDHHDGVRGKDRQSEETVSKTRGFSVADFNAVSLEGPDDVHVVYGSQPSVSATGGTRALDKLDIRVENGTLKIGRKRGWEIDWSDRDRDAAVQVTVPMIKAAAVSGSGNMSVDRVEVSAFTASVSGSGTMELAALQAKTADLAVSGSGNLDASGQVETANIRVVGSGDIDANGLTSVRAAISVGGSGGLSTTVTDTATVAVAGSGNVDVKGTNRCNITKSGSGEVSCNP